MAPELSVLRFLVDSALAAQDGKCLDEQDERRLVSDAIVAVVAEYVVRAEACEPSREGGRWRFDHLAHRLRVEDG